MERPRSYKVEPGTVPAIGGAEADFACAYAIDIPPGDDRSTEEWARAAWEGAPSGLRWFMWFGWRYVLGLRLGPRTSAGHILGWQIVENRPHGTVCVLRSWFLEARNTFAAVDDRLVWSTYVLYRRPLARVVWPPVSLLHRPLVRIALQLARRSGIHVLST